MTDRKKMTIFHAYQSFYYKTIAEIIGEILAGKITQNNLIEEVGNRGFQDISDTRGNRVNTTVSDGFQRGKWFLTVVDPSTKQYETVLLHKPTIPPSLMERRWLKAVLNDPRVQLFDLDRSRLDEWLADVDPLFTEEDIVFFDQSLERRANVFVACFNFNYYLNVLALEFLKIFFERRNRLLRIT